MAGNQYEAAARTRKVVALVGVLREAGASAEIASQFDIGQRLIASQAAGVRPPSDETWALVVQCLAAREARAA